MMRIYGFDLDLTLVYTVLFATCIFSNITFIFNNTNIKLYMCIRVYSNGDNTSYLITLYV